MITIAKLMTVAALIGSAALAGAGTASAGTEAGPVCPARSGGIGATYSTVTCTSGPGTTYASYIECTDGRAYSGPFVRYSPALWSERDCPTGYKVTLWGVLTH
ncbi:hypothetical protein [Amycolatopsis sp. NBC_01286]|uniref:hypothetical protein n=1 Tax=Amycolatopsis sp. NBC_01286 TaxID=2903560 RepID=UPI002E134B7A|nr:hypothetical protein OG570_26465 [Amycolatopsis sp. NBC_01286]